MQLIFHGGKCCGIKTIYGFSHSPDDDDECPPLKALSAPDDCDRYGGTPICPSKRFFHLGAPREGPRERLHRYLEYLRERRPSGIVEVALAEDTRYPQSFLCQSKWFPVLEELGFVRVNKCVNSNTGRMIHVFHLNMGEK